MTGRYEMTKRRHGGGGGSLAGGRMGGSHLGVRGGGSLHTHLADRRGAAPPPLNNHGWSSTLSCCWYFS